MKCQHCGSEDVKPMWALTTGGHVVACRECGHLLPEADREPAGTHECDYCGRINLGKVTCLCGGAPAPAVEGRSNLAHDWYHAVVPDRANLTFWVCFRCGGTSPGPTDNEAHNPPGGPCPGTGAAISEGADE